MMRLRILFVGLSLSTGVLAQVPYQQGIGAAPERGQWQEGGSLRGQAKGQDYLSKADVMYEVKERYNAQVLKISLIEEKEIYRVRLLMPNGKIKSISVDARR